MFVEAENFKPSAAEFPQLTAGTVIIGCTLLLTRSYLPDSLAALFEEDTSEFIEMTEPDELEGVEGNQTPSQEAENGQTVETRVSTIPSTVFTTLTISGYTLAGYLFGLLWVTPLFVAFYMWWYKLDARKIILTAAISFAVVYGFILFLYVPFDEGILLDPPGVFDII